MVSRLAAAAVLLGSTLLTSPVSAQSPTPPPLSSPSHESATTVPAGTEIPDPGKVDVENLNLGYVKGYLTDAGKMASSPARWEKSDWLKLGVVLGGTAGLFLLDEPVRDFTQSNQGSIGSALADIGSAIGNPVNAVAPLAGFYLYGYLADDSKARRVSLLAAESFTLTAALTGAVKTVAGRHGPDTGDGAFSWDGPKLDRKNSFCSAHTSSAFALATVFADEYRENPYVAPVAYGLAGFVALSRIYRNKHWSSDTFFGAALGYFTSKAVLSYHKEEGKADRRLTVAPQVGREMAGLTVSYDF